MNLETTHFSLDVSRSNFREILERDGEIKGMEDRWRTRTGRIIYIRESARAIKDEKGNTQYYEGTVEDITETKLAELEHFKLLNILELSINEIYIFDAQTLVFQYVNSEALRNLGFSGSEMQKMTPIHIKPEFDETTFREFISPLLDRKESKLIFNTVHCRKDKTLYHVEVNLQLIEQGEQKVFLAIILDVSEKKQAFEKAKQQEQQLIQADKMIALGNLVSGVAHEINNPNNFVMMNTPLLEELFQGVLPIMEKYYHTTGDFSIAGLQYSDIKESIPELLSGIMAGAKRIKNIVKELKDFARQDSDDDLEQLVDINTVVKSSITLTSPMIKKYSQKFSCCYGKNIPNTRGRFQRLEQVVINLIQNSCQSLADKDKAIYITTGYQESSSEVVVKVVDEGCGIQPDDIKRIMDPFFTTKRDSGGTGLGLSISSNIIRAHGGRLSFHSKPGQGTTATIHLPLRTDEKILLSVP